MDKIQETKAKVAELTSQIIGQKTMQVCVKFPMSTEEAAINIEAALRAEVELRNNEYKEVEGLQEHIRDIAELFTLPTAKFGIVLCGNVGNGKSSMMKALQRLLIRLDITISHCTSFETLGMIIISAKELGRLIRADEKYYLHYRDVTMLGIDDLGVEEADMMDYGNRITPIIDLLSYRYDRMLFTMVTTNLAPKQIRDKYGDRIADRFNEMMILVYYQNPSFRTPEKTREETKEV